MRPLRHIAAVVAVTCVATGLVGRPSGAATPLDSIPADCSLDVTSAVQAAIDATPDGATLAFPPGACYRIDGLLRVKDRNHLTIDGGGSTFRAFTDGTELVNPKLVRTRAMWNFAYGTGVTVRDLVTIGANPAAGRGDRAYQPRFEAQHAYKILATDSMVMDGVEAYDVYGDFVWVGPGTTNLTVRNSTFSRNGRQGWTINGTDIVFEHNTISETRRATVDMEPSSRTWASKNIHIRYNTVGKGRLYFLASAGAAAPIDNVNIIGNRLVGKPMKILVMPPEGVRTNYRIIDNVSTGRLSGRGGAFGLRNVVGIEIRGNVQPVQKSHRLFGVGLFRSRNVTITGNTFPGAKGVWIDRGGNQNVTSSANLIGHPPAVAPPSTVLGPTPMPTR